MNVTQRPTLDQLRDLLRSVDDDSGHHILWVGHSGEVHLDPLPSHLTPAMWIEKNRDHVRSRYETLGRGNGYVGPEAAKDDEWVSTLFEWLLQDWAAGRRGYIDVPGDPVAH